MTFLPPKWSVCKFLPMEIKAHFLTPGVSAHVWELQGSQVDQLLTSLGWCLLALICQACSKETLKDPSPCGMRNSWRKWVRIVWGPTELARGRMRTVSTSLRVMLDTPMSSWNAWQGSRTTGQRLQRDTLGLHAQKNAGIHICQRYECATSQVQSNFNPSNIYWVATGLRCWSSGRRRNIPGWILGQAHQRHGFAFASQRPNEKGHNEILISTNSNLELWSLLVHWVDLITGVNVSLDSCLIEKHRRPGKMEELGFVQMSSRHMELSGTVWSRAAGKSKHYLPSLSVWQMLLTLTLLFPRSNWLVFFHITVWRANSFKWEPFNKSPICYITVYSWVILY